MIRAICLIRTSTIQQEIEAQLNETIGYAKEYGYNEEELLVIGGKGASAIKLDERYLNNINQVYEAIESNKNIDCVFAWSIDRIGRNEVVLHTFKEYLISHKVNLRIKSIKFSLFDENGEINIVNRQFFTMFALQAESEMQQKKERFARARKRNQEIGKYNGGYIKFGYTIDQNNMLIPHEQHAEEVKTIYRLYATDKFSISQLAEELNKMGVSMSNKGRLHKILTDKSYIGEGLQNVQPIIDNELFDKVQDILQKNQKHKARSFKHNFFGIKIIKCKDCGYNFIADGRVYRCFGRHTDKNKCNNPSSINLGIMDGILWQFAQMEHLEYLTNSKKESVEEYNLKLLTINKKIAALENIEEEVKEKILRVHQGFEEGIYTEEQRNTRIANIRSKYSEQQKGLVTLIEQQAELEKRIQELNGTSDEEILLNNILNAIENPIVNSKEIYDIVRKHIQSVYITPTQYKDTNKAYQIEICLYRGHIIQLVYLPYNKNEKVYFLKNGKPLLFEAVEHLKDGTVILHPTETTEYRKKKRELIIQENKKLLTKYKTKK